MWAVALYIQTHDVSCECYRNSLSEEVGPVSVGGFASPYWEKWMEAGKEDEKHEDSQGGPSCQEPHLSYTDANVGWFVQRCTVKAVPYDVD